MSLEKLKREVEEEEEEEENLLHPWKLEQNAKKKCVWLGDGGEDSGNKQHMYNIYYNILMLYIIVWTEKPIEGLEDKNIS